MEYIFKPKITPSDTLLCRTEGKGEGESEGKGEGKSRSLQ
jgi:hypothetical protein